MNFYKHHIGDYAKKTAHLTVLEHGAYLLMLHAYYGTEKPLPFGRDLYRICRAFGKKERAAVDKVADQFWTRTDVGYVNGRAFEEIKEASELSDIARENGKLGGRPKKPSGLSENNPAGSFLEPSGKAIQTPDSIIQNKGSKNRPVKTSLPEDFSLTPELEQYATERLPAVHLAELLEGFRGKATAKGWTYANWRQAFQEFVRNCMPASGHWAAGQYPKTAEAKISWR